MTQAPTRPPTRRGAPPRPVRHARSAAAVTAPALAMQEGRFEPPRIILNAVEGWGKTSLGAYAPGAAMLMAAGETGYLTLLGVRRVPQVPSATLTVWQETLAVLDTLAAGGDLKVLVLDAMNGFERQCHKYICDTEFGGVEGERGFSSFQKGYELSVTEWLRMLYRLDRIRETTGATILLLSHSKVGTFKNPLGADFDRYIADCHPKTWAVTSKWADAVLFGTFRSIVETKSAKAPEALKKGKGIGGTDRVLYTEHRDGFDAKNRYGLPDEIDMPNDPAAMWGVVWNAITGKEG